jgi:hypothetical protein
MCYVYAYLFKFSIPPYSILIAKHLHRQTRHIKTNILSNCALLQYICALLYMFRLIKSHPQRHDSIHNKTAD